ncbi:glycosyltransferase family 4 protein [Ruegeria sp. Ofav3-42]|uniref:glycosyltransferase family 4 protein n=1 Tax=Ruegeria sp. Ofav3-42 TaxID=2917759 RepID=UPI001EF670E7|nr:glycosyltransferase family 4 protein [Ruegeria sp. Ofav3-42]
MKILLLANSSFKLINFRGTLIRELVAQGHDLIAVAPRDDYTQDFEQMGVRFVDLKMSATGTSVPAELALLARVFRIVRQHRPDAILGYTIKPNIYGALSARMLGIPFLPNVTGLGSVFDKDTLLSRVVKFLYRTAFRRCPRVFLQNPEDLATFVDNKLIAREQACLLPGSGVDLQRFPATPLPGTGKNRCFTLVARMLREKGIIEFVEAARAIAPEFPEARFVLLGPYGGGKAGGLDEAEINALTKDGIVEYHPSVKDVRPVVASADCVVLPSFYREGTPRSLLEAAAMGRPIITTTQPGCKDVVDHGSSGFLCAPKSVESLADAMRNFLELGDVEMNGMGARSREIAETVFDEKIVIASYNDALQSAASAR